MYNFPIGVIIDSFRCDLKEAVKKAAAVGANGIQVYASRGEMDPDNMTTAKRKEFLDVVKSNGLVISALCGDLGGGGFSIPENNPWKIEKSKRFAVKPMDPEEACFQMELLGHNFYVFRNSQTDEVNVVYKRKANTYGLIEPEF